MGGIWISLATSDACNQQFVLHDDTLSARFWGCIHGDTETNPCDGKPTKSRRSNKHQDLGDRDTGFKVAMG